ncbi:MAG: Glu/Leu/Phe/Val dehydrogenase dimerization domain-containing protein [Candidatus Omnitrophota bacterium]
MKEKIIRIAIALIFSLNCIGQGHFYHLEMRNSLRPPASRMNIFASDKDDSKKNVLDIAEEQLEHISRILGISQTAVDLILEPEKSFRLATKIILDDGVTPYRSEFIRVRQSTLLGPAKGGIRYALEINPAVTQGLAFLMFIKTAGSELPLGGGKGEAVVDIERLNLNEIARDAKEKIWQAMKQYEAFGEEVDIPAPDQKTGPTIMAYMTDALLAWKLATGTLKNKDAQEILLSISAVQDALENCKNDYKRIRKKETSDTECVILDEAVRLVNEEGFVISELASFTGKPVDRGGSSGRVEATGLGGFYAEIAVLEYYALSSDIFKGKTTVNGLTHVLRGLGNVATEYAKICSENGGKFNAIANSVSAIKYTGNDGEGIKIDKLLEFVKRKRYEIFTTKLAQTPDISKKARSDLWELIKKIDIDLTGYEQKGVIPLIEGEDIIDIQADILVEAATHCTIHGNNAHRVRQKMILELGNAPTTRQADVNLAKKGIIIIPDVLANTGGAIVSMYEAKQNMTGVVWPIELTYARLEERIRKAVDNMFNFIKEHPFEKFSNRDAHWALSLKRITDAMEARMWRQQDERLSDFSAQTGSFLKGMRSIVETDDQLWKLYASGPLAMQRAIDEEAAARGSRLLRMANKIAFELDEQDPKRERVRLCLIGGPTTYKVQTVKQIIDILDRNYGLRGVYFDLDFSSNIKTLLPLLNGESVSVAGPFSSGDMQDAGQVQLKPGDVIIAEGSYAIANETLDMLPKGTPRIAIATDICPSMKVTAKGGRHLMLTNDDYTLLREMLVSKYMRIGKPTPYVSVLNAVRHRREAISTIYTTFHNRADVIYNTYDPFELLFIRNLALPILEGALEASQGMLMKKNEETENRTESRHVRRVARHLIRILLSLPDIDSANMQLELPPAVGFRQILPQDAYTKRPILTLPCEILGQESAGRNLLNTAHLADITSEARLYAYPWSDVSFRISRSTYWNDTRTKRIIQHIENSGLDLMGKRVFVPGAGCGILAVYAASKGAYVVASEIQHVCCEDMRFNVRQAGLEGMVEIREGHFLETLSDSDKFDLVLCHPPVFNRYYSRQSANIVDRNFNFIKSFIAEVPQRLNPEGSIVLLYTSAQSAIDLTSPEDDIYLFNMLSVKTDLKESGFNLTDAYPENQVEESTIWEITRINGPAAVQLSSDFILRKAVNSSA